MIIERHPNFKKNYKKRIGRDRQLVAKTKKRIQMVSSNPRHPLLRDHALTGSRQGFRSFSVTGDIRIIYRELSSDHIILFDIGSHNQVYR